MFYFASVRISEFIRSQTTDRSSGEVVGVDTLHVQQEGGQEEGDGAMHSADQEDRRRCSDVLNSC